MRTRYVAAALLLLLLGAGTIAGAVPSRQWAVVYLREPTLIGSMIVQGPVLFVHDDERMARGQPCTTVQLFEPGNGPTESVAAFHCMRLRRPVVHTFTVTTRPNVVDGFGCVLTEFQFPDEAEGHGVPLRANAH